jgi:hypothetical protein
MMASTELISSSHDAHTVSYSMGPAVPLYLASSGSLVLDIMLMESATQWAQQSHYVWLAMSSLIADSFYKLQKMNV